MASQAQLPKNSRQTKKNQKNNPVRRILGKSIQDCFFCFFGLFGFSRGFLVSQAPTVQKLEANQKKQKNNPVRRILGKSIQDCFFWFIWFFSRVFAVPSPTVQKLEATELFLWKREKNIYICICIRLYGTDYPIIYLKEVGSRKKIRRGK